ncbi:MAG: ABC transporter permease [Ruminococcaceae bacterium]|nr:ABC transporter permease [Oscillospiraceae bacterium]
MMERTKNFIDMHFWIWAVFGSLVMWGAVGAASANFNLSSLIANGTSAAFLSIAALGQMIVITTGRGAIDLSIPGMITLSAFLTMGIVNGNDANFISGLLIVAAVGLLVGLLNSMIVIYLKITPMIATMAMGYIISTASLLYNRGFTAFQVCPILLTVTRFRILGIPLVVYLVLLLTFGIFYLFKRVTYGQSLLALGQNKQAAFFAGIRVNRVEMIAYMMSSLLAAVTGMLLSARVGGAFLGMGDTYMLDTVGSVVIGGTLISGGRASPFGTLAGALFLSLLITAMQVANFSLGAQNIVKGILIILVLIMGTKNKKSA